MISDEEALIRAIQAAPDDDLPRLVDADRLEEAGDIHRANLIRVQCKRESLEAQLAQAKAEEKKLLDERDPARELVLAIGARYPDVTFEAKTRRGFITELSGSASTLIKALDHPLTKKECVTALTITRADNPAIFDHAAFQNIRELTIDCEHGLSYLHDHDGDEFISRLLNCHAPKLEMLKRGFHTQSTMNERESHDRYYNRARYRTTRFGETYDSFARALVATRNLPNLKWVETGNEPDQRLLQPYIHELERSIEQREPIPLPSLNLDRYKQYYWRTEIARIKELRTQAHELGLDKIPEENPAPATSSPAEVIEASVETDQPETRVTAPRSARSRTRRR